MGPMRYIGLCWVAVQAADEEMHLRRMADGLKEGAVVIQIIDLGNSLASTATSSTNKARLMSYAEIL